MDKLEISGLPEDDPTLTPPSDNESSEKSRVSSEDGDSGKKSGKKKKKSAGRYAAEFFIKIGVTALIIWALCSEGSSGCTATSLSRNGCCSPAWCWRRCSAVRCGR